MPLPRVRLDGTAACVAASRGDGVGTDRLRGDPQEGGETMNEALVELFRHKTWATLLLIEACQGLDEEMLDATTPGTYGTIRDTLHHLVTTALPQG
jgi:hypothetical protein